MEAPPRARAYVPLPVQQTGSGVDISLFAARGIPAALHQPTGGRDVPIVRLKRKVDATINTLSVDRSTKKALHEELASLAVTVKKPTDANAELPKPATPTNPQRKLYRRVASYSARTFEHLQGAEALLDRIWIKNEDLAVREASKSLQRKRQDEQRERAKQQQAESHRLKPVSAKPSVMSQRQKENPPLRPVSSGRHPTRQQLAAEEQRIIMNCMPLVREFLQTERKKAALAKPPDASMSDVLDEYEVEVFEALPEGTEAQSELFVTLEPFEDKDLLVFDGEYADSDHDAASEDSNDEDHPNNDYPEEPEDDEDKDSSAEENGFDDLSSDEDVWAMPARRERYAQASDSD